MTRRWKLTLAAALLIVGAYAITGAARTVRAETHSGCATFDASGNLIGFTPDCSQTVHATPSTSVSPGVNPCNGATGTVVTNTDHSVLHVSVNGAGDAWVSGTEGGTASFTADNPSDASGQGTWTAWFGDHFNNRSTTSGSTTTTRIALSDGSHVIIHDNTHTTITPAGVTTTFDHPTLSCG